MTISSTVTPIAASVGRCLRALFLAQGNPVAAIAYVEGQGGMRDTPQVMATLKAMVDPLSTGNGFALTTPVGYDFAAYVKPRVLIGRLPLLRAPFRTRLIRGSGPARAAFTGQGKPVPVTHAEFDAGTTLESLRVSAIAVLSNELVKLSQPAADAVIVAEVAAAIVAEIDRQFIDPARAGEPGVSPASITSGAPQFTATGVTPASIDHDLRRLMDALIAAGMDLSSANWCMAPSTAAHLSILRSGDQAAYPQVNAIDGGRLAGLPVALSPACLAAGSPGDATVALIQCSEVLLADDNEATVELSQAAALQMSDAPAAGAQQLVSVWQRNNTAIRASRFVNWLPRRPGASAVLTDVQW